MGVLGRNRAAQAFHKIGQRPVKICHRRVTGELHVVLSSQFSVLSSQFSVLSSQFSVLSSQFSVLSSQFSVLRNDNRDFSEGNKNVPQGNFWTTQKSPKFYESEAESGALAEQSISRLSH